MVIIVLAGSIRSIAQPALPSLACAAERGVVMLSWQCQYDGVKAIAVRRSKESGFNYKIVGYVKDVAKGRQAFADGHPEVGRNYYKLHIVFNSGVTWTSNVCEIDLDSAQLYGRDTRLPHNDSLQKFLSIDHIPLGNVREMRPGDASARRGPISVSFDAVAALPIRDTAAERREERTRITLRLPVEDITEPVFIRSKYVTVSRLTGHVEVVRPVDKHDHLFSIKFYTESGKLRVDVPDIAEQAVIIDKRNFQRKGNYRFVLLHDGAEYESGYIYISP